MAIGSGRAIAQNGACGSKTAGLMVRHSSALLTRRAATTTPAASGFWRSSAARSAFGRWKPPENPDPLIDEIIHLKEAWLTANDPRSPLLGDDGIILRKVLDEAWKSGMTRIFVLESGDKIAAASINFVYAGRMEAYFTAYDAAFERASPGTILIVEYACWAFDQGLAHVDFLRGEEAFKFRMANAEVLLASFSGSRTLLGQVAVSGHRWLSRRRQRNEPSLVSVDETLEPVE